MFNWLKRILGIASAGQVMPTGKPVPTDNAILGEKVVTPKTPKKTTKKKTAKKTATVDLNSMKKNELLAHAKANGVKANASMKKADLITAIKNG